MYQFLKEYNRTLRNNKILKIINLPQNGTFLDLSCSNGKFLNHLHKLSPELKLFGIDISSEDIKKAKINCPFASFTQESVDKLSFPDNTFDFVFSAMSLHHYENPKNSVEEIRRVLKEGGALYIVDLIPKYTWTQKIYNWKGCPEPYHFEKFYSIEDLEKILESRGFSIVKDRRISLIPRVRLLNITKKP